MARSVGFGDDHEATPTGACGGGIMLFTTMTTTPGQTCWQLFCDRVQHAAVLLVIVTVVFARTLSLAEAGEEVTAEPPRPLRLLTYNLLHGGPASGFLRDDSLLDVRLEMVLQEIRALDPDIITLQEVSQSRQYGDVPARIAAELGFHIVYGPATGRIFGGSLLDKLVIGMIGFKEGVAILSRFPIMTSRVHDLPRCGRWYDSRIVLEATVSTPWQALQVFTTHPSRHALCQAPRIAELITERRGDGPSLLMGDLNAAETSLTAQLPRETGFVDVFRAANPDVPGLTVYQHIRNATPTVFRRVDYIFLYDWRDPAVRDSKARVLDSRVVLDRPGKFADGSVLWPSDHYGVFAEVEINP